MIIYPHFDPIWVTKMVTNCYIAFKIVSFGLMVRFNKLDVSLVLPNRSGSTRVTHERRSATKLTDTIPLYAIQDIICY